MSTQHRIEQPLSELDPQGARTLITGDLLQETVLFEPVEDVIQEVTVDPELKPTYANMEKILYLLLSQPDQTLIHKDPTETMRLLTNCEKGPHWRSAISTLSGYHNILTYSKSEETLKKVDTVSLNIANLLQREKKPYARTARVIQLLQAHKPEAHKPEVVTQPLPHILVPVRRHTEDGTIVTNLDTSKPWPESQTIRAKQVKNQKGNYQKINFVFFASDHRVYEEMSELTIAKTPLLNRFLLGLGHGSTFAKEPADQINYAKLIVNKNVKPQHHLSTKDCQDIAEAASAAGYIEIDNGIYRPLLLTAELLQPDKLLMKRAMAARIAEIAANKLLLVQNEPNGQRAKSEEGDASGNDCSGENNFN